MFSKGKHVKAMDSIPPQMATRLFDSEKRLTHFPTAIFWPLMGCFPACALMSRVSKVGRIGSQAILDLRPGVLLRTPRTPK